MNVGYSIMIDFKFRIIAVVYVHLQVVLAEPPHHGDMPRLCLDTETLRQIKNDNLMSCCKMEPLVTEADMAKCGFKMQEAEATPKKGSSAKQCQRILCMMKKWNVVKDGEIDVEMMKIHLNKYAKRNPDFKSAVTATKKYCLSAPLTGYPTDHCPAINMIMCLTNSLFFGCPGWQTDPRCDHVKDYMRVCHPYYLIPQ